MLGKHAYYHYTIPASLAKYIKEPREERGSRLGRRRRLFVGEDNHHPFAGLRNLKLSADLGLKAFTGLEFRNLLRQRGAAREKQRLSLFCDAAPRRARAFFDKDIGCRLSHPCREKREYEQRGPRVDPLPIRLVCFLEIFHNEKRCATIISMLFNKRHRRKVGIIWGVLCVLIIVSMIALYLPVLYS